MLSMSDPVLEKSPPLLLGLPYPVTTVYELSGSVAPEESVIDMCMSFVMYIPT